MEQDTDTTVHAIECEPWTTSVVDSKHDVGASPSLASDADGVLHALYRDASLGDLKYATRSLDGAWAVSVLARGYNYAVGAPSSIAVDGAGGVHAIYTDYNSTRGLWYRYKPQQGAWAQPLLIDPMRGTVVHHVSLAVDHLRRVHVAYRDEWAGTLRYATKQSTGTAFTRQLLAGNNAGTYISTTADTAGGLHITYFDFDRFQLRYLYRSPAGAFSSPVILDATKQVGTASTVVVDAAGTVHVAYTYRSQVMKYTRRTGGAWSTPIVTKTDVGEQAELALDEDDGLVLAYSERTKVAYTRLASGGESFEPTIIDDDVGTRGVQLAHTRAAGRSHVIYYDRINNDLQYAAGTCTD